MKRRADDYERPAKRGLVGKAIGVDEDEDAKTKYVPVHEQIVTDENGKRRFHGAFEGGFAAGYFNTVGSKEGWTPSTFVSSRSNKAKMANAKPEDFMDESDKIQIYGAKELTTTKEFDLLGGTAAELERRNNNTTKNERENASSSIPGPIPDELIVPAEDPIGIRLLRVMGWRAGQGIGSRLRRKTKQKEKEKKEKETEKQKEGGRKVYGVELPPELQKIEEESDEEEDIHALNHTFAREDTQEVEYKAKNDMYGIGYDPYTSAPEFRDKKAQASKPINTKITMSSIFGGKHSSQEGAFGIGAYEEADDEEVYSADNMEELFDGPPIEKIPPKKAIEAKPDFQKPSSGPVRRCSDGLLPLKNFTLATRSMFASKWFPPVAVPANFKPIHIFDSPLPPSSSSSSSVSAPASSSSTHEKLDANTRAVMLGEERMPITSKPSSVFDFLSPADRAKLSNLTGKFIPGTNPLTPEQQEEQKRKLEEQNKKMEAERKRLEEEKRKTEEERKKMEEKRQQEQKALQEKQLAAQQQAQQAILSMLSSRFAKAEDASVGTLSTQVHKGGQTTAAEFAKTLPPLLGAPSSQDTAASYGMLGKLTRSEVEWRPNNLLCKRFNLRNPHADNEVDTSNTNKGGSDWMEQLGASQGPTFGLEFPDKEVEKTPVTTATSSNPTAQGATSLFSPTSASNSSSSTLSAELLDEEEVTRPSIDLFKAIFEAEDEEPEKEEDEDENDSEEERVKEEERQRELENEREREKEMERRDRERRTVDQDSRRTGWDKTEIEEEKPKIQTQVHITEDLPMDDDVIWVERSADDIQESKKKEKKDKHKKDKKDKKEKKDRKDKERKKDKEKKDKHKHKKDKKDKDKHNKHRDRERDRDSRDRDRDRDREKSRDKYRD